MPTTWENEPRYEGAPSIVYEESTVLYDSPLYNYNGQLITVWTNELVS